MLRDREETHEFYMAHGEEGGKEPLSFKVSPLSLLSSSLSVNVVLYRDTGSVDSGLGPIFGSVSGSEIHILGIAYAKDTFSLY